MENLVALEEHVSAGLPVVGDKSVRWRNHRDNYTGWKMVSGSNRIQSSWAGIRAITLEAMPM